MKTSCIALLVACSSGATSSSFEDYKKKFGKEYASPADEARAKECWEENVQYIDEQNNADTKVVLDENTFSDQCWEDFKSQRLLPNDNGICTKTPIPEYPNPADLSKAVDRRNDGYVNPVKDQKSCGSCWAFSAVGCMEGAYFKATGKLLSFSEQQLVSCNKGANNGCSGGMPGEAFDYAVKTGMTAESDYTYTAKDGTCQQGHPIVANFAKWQYIPSNKDEKVLVAALQNEGPISITLNANQLWHSYSGGIVGSSNCPGGHGINHAVLAVGYGKDGDKAYYIVRNSWGPSWGESGYIRLAFNENTCGLKSCLSAFITGKGGPQPPGPSPTPSPPSPPTPPTPPSPPSPPPSPPPVPPSPPSPFPPGFDCMMQFKQGDCEAKATEGCHWCTFGAGMCFRKEQQCPGVVV